MIKKMLLLITIILISLTNTGCWNYYELSDLAIITSIGIDKIDNNYKLSLIVANTSSNTSGSDIQAKTTILTGTGKTMGEAFIDAKTKSSKEIYTGHFTLLLISEEIANNNMYEVLESIVRNPESIRKVAFVIAKDATSNEILKTLSPLETFPSETILLNIRNSVNSIGISHEINVSDFVYKLVNYGYDNLLPTISIEGKKQEENNVDSLNEIEMSSILKVDDIALFKDYEIVGYANYNDSKNINILTNKVTSLTTKIRCYDDLKKYITIKIDDPKTSIEVNSNNLKYKFKIEAEGAIYETNCKLDLKDPKVIKQIEVSAKSDIYSSLNNTIDKLKTLKTDILGLGNLLYKKDYKKWYSLKDNWDIFYSNLDYDIDLKFSLKTKGSLENTIEEDKK